jgi:hypothetical protein
MSTLYAQEILNAIESQATIVSREPLHKSANEEGSLVVLTQQAQLTLRD